MEIVAERKIVILTSLFAFMGFLTLLAPFSVYKLPGMYFIAMAILVSYYLLCSSSPGVLSNNRREMVLFGCGWAFIYLISTLINSSIPSLFDIFAFIYGILFLSFSRVIQVSIIKRFVWLLSFVLFFAIIEYLLYQFTHFGFVIGSVSRITAVRQTYFVHLLFNLISTSYMVPRFQCLANEPGLIGTLCGFLIFFTWKVKSMRFPFFVFLFSGLIAFSLAFYVLFAFFLLTTFRFNIRNVVILIISSIVLYLVLKENFEQLIVSRVEVDDVEDIDNRTTDIFDHYYNKAYEKGQLWLGVGADNLPPQITMGETGGNAGAKKWIFQFGIIGFVIIFMVYNIIYRLRKNGRMTFYDLMFLLIYWLSFYQRSSIIPPYTLLVFLAMPICNEFKLDTPKLLENESNSSN